jgi:hypothetical protein
VVPRTAVLALVLLLAAVAAAVPRVVPPGEAELRATALALTAPEMEGRGSGTPGGDLAARYLADALAAAGLRPGGDGGTYLQPFFVRAGTRVAPGAALAPARDGARALEIGREWTPHGGSASGEAVAEVVFAGHGLVDAEAGHDDYGGADVRGALVLVLDGAPAALGDRPATRLEKLIEARRRGARGLLLVERSLPALDATGAAVDLLSGSLTPAGADALLAPAASLAAVAAGGRRGAVATGVAARLRVALEREDRHAANVIGVLPGADPQRAAEAVLGLARAFAAAGGAPRTLVFALFSGEEMGLVGSGHHVRQPAHPIERTVAMVNFDMVGRLASGRLSVGGVDSGAGLRQVVADAGRATGLVPTLHGSPYSPSDHQRFYDAGVPVLFFFTGVHADYHRPSDTADRLDVAGMARIAALAADVVERLAGGPPPAYAAVERPARPGRPAPAGTAGEAFLGVWFDVQAASDGVRLRNVVPDSAAARAGLRDGDVLVRFGGVPVNAFEDLRRILRSRRPGDTVEIVYLREGRDRQTAATLDARR